MSWTHVGESSITRAQALDAGPVETRKLRIGWVSTWNTKCGIADLFGIHDFQPARQTCSTSIFWPTTGRE